MQEINYFELHNPYLSISLKATDEEHYKIAGAFLKLQEAPLWNAQRFRTSH